MESRSPSLGMDSSLLPSQSRARGEPRAGMRVVGSVLLVGLLVATAVAIVLVVRHDADTGGGSGACLETDGTNTSCPTDSGVEYHIVESIPLGMGDLEHNMTIYEALMDLLTTSTETVDIACFYMTFTDGNATVGGTPGQNVYDAIVAAAKRNVKVRIVTTSPSDTFPNLEAKALQAAGYADVRFLDFEKAINKSGVLHTKVMIGDNSTFYVGSANMDWRSLTQVKELGAYVKNSGPLAQEVDKAFLAMWTVAGGEAVPDPWPYFLQSNFSSTNPLSVELNGTWSSAYISHAPPALTPPRWTHDIDDIRGHMEAAEEFIHIEMMDYVPAVIYQDPSTYWPDIDDAIRSAAYRNVSIRMLIGYWEHSLPAQHTYLESLAALPQVDIKYFIVPPFHIPLPYTRVAHDKWFVTDKALFIGTSNWTGDYFTNTCGLGLAMNNTEARAVLKGIHERDWNSQYAHPLPGVKTVEDTEL